MSRALYFGLIYVLIGGVSVRAELPSPQQRAAVEGESATLTRDLQQTSLRHNTLDSLVNLDGATQFALLLKQAAHKAPKSVRAYYQQAGWSPIWARVNTEGASISWERASALLDALDTADSHALPTERYAAAALRQRMALTRVIGEGAAELERDLSASFISFARDVNTGALDPRRVDKEILRHRPEFSAANWLKNAAAAQDVAKFLQSLPPQDSAYIRLRALYAQEREWGELTPAGPSLRPEQTDERVSLLRSRLEKIGDWAPKPFWIEQEDGSKTLARLDFYDSDLLKAVKAFQKRHGLEPDGLVGAKTLAQLNQSWAQRRAQIAANIERMRWMNFDRGDWRVEVNIADYQVDLIKEDQVVFETRAIVGAKRHQTPEFSDVMSYIVVNPRWNVPTSIVREEIFPKLVENPDYLAENNMVLLDLDGDEVPIHAIDLSFYTSRTFPFRVRQESGPGNALGDAKFIFPNAHAIYLHDTPARQLFSKPERAFSHGCVRVGNPAGLAHALLQNQRKNPQRYYQRLRDLPGERYVQLKEKPQIHLMYRTAWVDTSGEAHFRADVYGRDAKLIKALRTAGVTLD